MLANLKIENIAIIESASIDFTSGLNVMSGETGAGKSIILDSLNTILGERTSKDLVSGAKSAKVSAMFYDVPKSYKKLEEFDIEPEDDNSLLIQRSINLEGKNTCRINGFPITVTMLKSIGKELVNIHGQHDSQTLLNSDNHFEFIDALAENNIIIEKYKIAFNKMISFKKELKAMNINEEEKAKRIDFLQFQINELELADIKIGEKDGLLAKKRFIRIVKKSSHICTMHMSF